MPARYRLAESTLVEPLVSGWAAWWSMVAPAPSAFHAAQYQLPMLESFVKHPAIHVRSASDPMMTGSAFVNLPIERVAEVQAFIERTRAERKDALAFVDAWNAFEAKLLKEAVGQPMDGYYRELPAPLRGLVELLYDFQGRPSLRLLEPLTYHSPLYREALQSVRISAVRSDAARKFWLNTPRLPAADELDWHVPLRSEALQRLFALELDPQPLEEVERILDGQVSGAPLRQFLTDAETPPPPRWTGPGTRLRFFGHASVLVETPGGAVMFDPLVPVRPSAGGAPRFSYAELPARIELAAITHSHMDHFVLETLLRLRSRVKTLVVPKSRSATLGDASLKLIAERLGYADVREVDTFDAIPFPGGELISLPFLGEHGDFPFAKSTYVLRTGTDQLLFGADSACHDVTVYETCRRVVGPVEHIFINTETDGAPAAYAVDGLLPKARNRKLERTRRCRGSNAVEGLELFRALGGRHLYNYAMGLEPWVGHILGAPSAEETPRMAESDALLEKVKEAGGTAERLGGLWERVIGG